MNKQDKIPWKLSFLSVKKKKNKLQMMCIYLPASFTDFL